LAQILIISDDKEISLTLTQIIIKSGYLCDTVQSDADIFKVLSQKQYDLFCCDVRLNTTSGFKLVNSILIHYPAMVAILVANQTSHDFTEKLFASGGFDFLGVPVDYQRVRVTLRNAFNHKNSKVGRENSAVKKLQSEKNSILKIEQLTKELELTQRQLIDSEKMASIGQLVAGIAHEINNPVGFVASNLNTLQHYQKSLLALIVQYRRLLSEVSHEMDRPTTHSKVLKRVKKIKNLQTVFDLDYLFKDIRILLRESTTGISQVKTIVRDLKVFVHPGQDYPEFVDLHSHLDTVLNLVWYKLKYNITVLKDYGELPLVKCWISQINQVFLNIIVNAIQAISEKGSITIKTGVYENKWVEISIKDTGNGIMDGELNRIFDPFFTTKPAGEGTGLGLAISNNIIKKHKGTITVESKIGYGTTFKIFLPITLGKMTN
jgi:signal transduction histidine kinase